MEHGPVFSDPSGRRRRLMVRVGLAASGVLAIFLAVTVLAMTGGPEAPFMKWAAPHAPVQATHSANGKAVCR